MIVNGEIYATLTQQRNDSGALKQCMEATVDNLMSIDTTVHKPGMLLGKIQAGKTRAFIGIIALAFDNGYDMAIILQKGTKALARQTYERLKKDFHEFIEYDQIQLYDILHIPDRLPGWILKKKFIMIVKKETNNLERTIRAIVSTYPDLIEKKMLIIDDEADFASIGFSRKRQEGIIELRKIASQIDELRKKVKQSDFLQVTATPYSLYLQPDENILKQGENEFEFKPIRPAFTELLPIYSGYVGGEFYFNESKQEGTVAYYVYEELSREELDALKKSDGRTLKLEDVLTSRKVEILRRGILNFIVGTSMRRIHQRMANRREEKYCFVVHTESAKQSHDWQVAIVDELKNLLIYSASHNIPLLSELVKAAYDDLCMSVRCLSTPPTWDEVFEDVVTALREDQLMIIKVNSESEVEQFLDDNGELKRIAPLNIFVGGQILDRGITIKNLIGFYYGRRPGRFQQDTVLQHSRMFGNRPMEDLAVTRFYTAAELYSTMEKINEFDNALREAFIREAQKEVVFICKDPSARILPCSPNKIAISSTTTLTPGKRLLPVGFQTGYKSNIKGNIERLDTFIGSISNKNNREEPVLIDVDQALSIIDSISETFVYEKDQKRWDVKAFKASLEFLSKNCSEKETQGKVWCLARYDRNISRRRETGIFSDAPDTGRGETVLSQAREVAQRSPALILIRENGLKDRGWMDSPFWWPILVAPKRMKNVIFAEEVIDSR